MIVATLVDLGVPMTVVLDAVTALPMDGYHVHFGHRTRSGIVATSFDVHVETPQPERTYATVQRILDEANLSASVRSRAHRAFRRLAEAEASVHCTPLDDVHFHEVGSVDAIVDIVASAAALDYLDAELWVSPLPMGRGFVKARHGTLPLPAPATVQCLAGFDTYDGGLAFEFVTPTGAAIVGANARPCAQWPPMSPERSGWGAGRADLRDRPNLLRAILGTRRDETNRSHGDARPTHAVLEANLDDATGELVAHGIEKLLREGALDAWATPITMKKGRPAVKLSALVPWERADAFAELVLVESPSLGVRRHPVWRSERERSMVSVTTEYGEIPVKLSTVRGSFPQVKPEYEACAAVAREKGVALSTVQQAALVAAWPLTQQTRRS
jgi:uncharacterized protein (TIGR00299 family) protein